MSDGAKCPFTGSKLNQKGTYNEDWWTNRLDLSLLEKNISTGSPMDQDFDYAKEFETLNLNEVKRDIEEVMTTSQDWFPADYGNYGPLFIRMAWHSAGTYRTTDGRGGGGAGMLRFAPLNSWADNTNLDKARRILWSVKKKYGKKLSWADLMILAGNVALENMGLKTFGFSGGRADVFYADDTYWGSEKEWLADNRYSGDRELENPLAAVQMGLIYVNPEGPNGNPDPLLSARDIRETFARMAMNDEETVALIAGGHTFGKAHGAGDAANVGLEPEGAPIELGGLGWKNSFGKGNAEDTITSGIEGAWTATPTKWDNSYFETLFKYDWKQVKSPAGAIQWIPTDESAATLVPDAHVDGKFHAPMMTTADLALKFDSEYEKISRRFYEDFDAFADAFARAWFKLTHRDLGPVSRYVGSEVPNEVLIWQDPVPSNNGNIISDEEINNLKSLITSSGLTLGSLVETAWASASTFRNTDKRGGANGARILLEPQKSWESNKSATVISVINKLKSIIDESKSNISMADMIVLAGCTAIENAAKNARVDIKVPFVPGRTDATQEQTDIDSFKVLEPLVDGFRNFIAEGVEYDTAIALIDKALLLGLTIKEMFVLIAGMRSIGANYNGDIHGVLTDRVDTLSNDMLVNLLEINSEWQKSDSNSFYINDVNGNVRWRATRVDLLIASNSQLRAVAEVYAAEDGNEKFIKDFVSAWHKVMMLDRFDIK